MAFPGGSDGKESACSAGDLGSITGLGRSPGEYMATHSSILAWRIPMDRGAWGQGGYSPWHHKKLDMTEQLSTRTPGTTEKPKTLMVPSFKLFYSSFYCDFSLYIFIHYLPSKGALKKESKT